MMSKTRSQEQMYKRKQRDWEQQLLLLQSCKPITLLG